jgi:hypothetical protein
MSPGQRSSSRGGLARNLPDDAAEVLAAVRAAFARLVESLPIRIARAVDLSEALDLPRKLGWQVWRIVESASPYEAAQYLPGEGAIRSFLQAAARRGAPAALVAEAERAAARVGALVDTHAGDRASLDMMLGAIAGPAHHIEEQRRRDAFRGNSFIWGIQARTRLFTSIVAPGKGDSLDVAVLDGLIDLRRNRAGAPCVLAETWVRDSARPGAPIRMEPLWPAGDTDPALPPVIPEFCSSPMPAMRPVRVGEGHVRVELTPGAIGETGAITCITGHVYRGVGSRIRREGDPTLDFAARVNKPAEVLIHDLIVHRSLFGPIEPIVRVFSELSGPVVEHESLSRLEQLPMAAAVKHLGRGPDVAASSDTPRYTDLLRWTFQRLGWDGADFDVHRTRMRYPVVPSSVVLSVDLPERA